MTTTRSFILLLIILSNTNARESSTTIPRTALQYKISDLGDAIVKQTRRCLNFNNILGSVSSVPAYDRILSQPVFAVTTPWGSPYLLFEQKDATETRLEFDETYSDAKGDDNLQKTQNKARGRDSNTNQVALYFLDEHDAMQLRDEMLQLDQMKGADMRITTFSLGKALRQASNLNHGLLTGQPIDDLTGKLPSPQEGGSLRYKIVPPRKELFYAARCKGRERVGLFGSTPAVDARLMLSSFSTIGGVLRKRRMEAKTRESSKKDKMSKDVSAQGIPVVDDMDPIRKAYSHMNGFAGIPVFYSPDLRISNGVKGILRFDLNKRIPLFFSFEDLMECHSNSISKLKRDDKTNIQMEASNVEVFNLMDVISSIEQENWRAQRNRYQGILNFFRRKEKNKKSMTSKSSEDLNNIIFIPSSSSVKSKELTSRVGSGKAKFLRPMRAWGKDA